MPVTRRSDDERFSSGELADLGQVASEREAFRQWVEDRGIEPARADELAIIFSELGSNALGATHDSADLPEARAEAVDGRVVLEVRNRVADGDADAVHRWNLSDPLRSGGRGLMIVSALCDDLSIDHRSGWLVVRCQASV